MQIRILSNPMADKGARKRPNRMVTIDPGTVAEALKVGKRLKPPMDNLSRIIDVALAEWTDRNDHRKPK